MKLSIVIPTRSRARELDATLATFCKMIAADELGAQVEVVCVNNFSTDDTESVCARYNSRFSFFRYFKQNEERHSAETSALTAIDFATGDYCWIFGDDDTPLPGSISRLLSSLEKWAPEFILLNLLFDLGNGVTSTYINAFQGDIFFPHGLDFFRAFGLISTVTTMSCLCFKRKCFDRAVFEQLAAVSEIYSHSFSMFVTFRDKACLFSSEPSLIYVPSHESVELQRIGGHARAQGRPTYYAFSHGLLRLITTASVMTGLSIAEIAGFEEIVIDKTIWSVRHALLWCFIARVLIIEVKEDPDQAYSKASLDEISAFGCQLGPVASALFQLCFRLRDCQQPNLKTKTMFLEAALDRFEQRHFADLRGIQGEFVALSFQPGVMPKSVLTRRGDPPALSIVYSASATVPELLCSLQVEWIPYSESHELLTACDRASHDTILVLPPFCVPHAQSVLFALDAVRTGFAQTLVLDLVYRTPDESSSLLRSDFFGDHRLTTQLYVTLSDAGHERRSGLDYQASAMSRGRLGAMKGPLLRTSTPVGTVHCSVPDLNRPAELDRMADRSWTAQQFNAAAIQVLATGHRFTDSLLFTFCETTLEALARPADRDFELMQENAAFLLAVILATQEMSIVSGPQTQDWINHLRYLNLVWSNDAQRKIFFDSRIEQSTADDLDASSPIDPARSQTATSQRNDLLVVTQRMLSRMGLRRPNTGLIVRGRKAFSRVARRAIDPQHPQSDPDSDT